MKSKKSKVLTAQPEQSQLVDRVAFKEEKKEHLSQRELRLQQELKAQKRAALIEKVKKQTRQLLLLLFAIAVIFSMIALPLLIVFG